MDLDALARLVTVGLFGATGWFVSQRLRLPVALWTWSLMVLAAVVGIFVRFWVVSLFGFTIYANWAIVSCCLGALVGLTVRSFARRQVGRDTV
jgi:hypothetical protein